MIIPFPWIRYQVPCALFFQPLPGLINQNKMKSQLQYYKFKENNRGGNFDPFIYERIELGSVLNLIKVYSSYCVNLINQLY